MTLGSSSAAPQTEPRKAHRSAQPMVRSFTAIRALLVSGGFALAAALGFADDSKRGASIAPGAATVDGTPSPQATKRDLVVIEVTHQARLQELNAPVTWKGAGLILAEWTEAQEAEFGRTIPFEVIAADMTDGRSLYLLELREGEDAPLDPALDVLYRRGRQAIVESDAEGAEAIMSEGNHGVRLPHIPRGWEKSEALVPYNCAFNATTSALLGRTSQTQWMDWIEKISGAEPVVIGGATYTIATRNSPTMFLNQAHAKGYDFAMQQVQSWHYNASPASIEEDPYTGSGGATWKNLVLTIPGQTAPSEIVLLTAHFDSTSGSATTLAPGADDNGTGSAILFEAARLLRQFRFQRTIKLIWFTGEEQGTLGSAAYVADHPTASFLGDLNVDMAGYDSNADRCMEIHAGTLSQSQDIGNCFRTSITSYGTGLGSDFLTTTATDRSDHAEFWQVNVGAVEIAENFFNDSVGGCVGSDTNPNYHTVNDKLPASVVNPFGFDIAKTALATISAMAIPIQSCFASAPALSVSPGLSSVDVSWSGVAGASSYRVFRSTAGCGGQWFEIANTPGTIWPDTTATENTTYSYYVEAVAADGFCVSAMSNCGSAVPSIIHAASSSGPGIIDVCGGGGPGNGNGILDPGESLIVPVTLQNDGNTALTNISGILSTSTPGVAILDATAAWPNLAPGNSAPSSPNHFRLRLDDSMPCNAAVNASLALSYAQGANGTILPLQAGAPMQSVLLNETFNAGIPVFWSVVNGGSGGGAAATWTTANPGARSITLPFSSAFAIVDSDNAGAAAAQDEQLITPTLNAGGCSQLKLEFSNQFRWFNSSQNEIADVDVSTNGGSSWTNVLRMQGASDGYTTPNTKTVDIAAAVAANPANVKVRFHYYQALFEWWWAIDNVKVSCTGFSCTPCAGGGSAPGEAGDSSLFTVQRGGGNLSLAWDAPDGGCSAFGYSIYKGSLSTLRTTGYSHGTALSCAPAGTSFNIPETDPRLGSADYYLVVAHNGSEEGSYGRASSGAERPASGAACKAVQDLASCGP